MHVGDVFRCACIFVSLRVPWLVPVWPCFYYMAIRFLFRARILFSFNRVFFPSFAKIWRDVESKQSLITLTSVFATFVCSEAAYQPAYRTCLCRSARAQQASNPFVLDRSVVLPSVYMGSCKFLI